MVYCCGVSVSSGCVCCKDCCDWCEDKSEKDGGGVTNNNISISNDVQRKNHTKLYPMLIDLQKVITCKLPLPKYDKDVCSHIKKYDVYNIFAVPFLSCYSGFMEVCSFWAFELGKEYFSIFPNDMCERVLEYIKDNNIQPDKFHVFVEYQYTTMFSIDENDYKTDHGKILLRPHLFFADQQGLKTETLMENTKKAVLDVHAYCVLSDGKQLGVHNNINFSVHNNGSFSPLEGWFADGKTLESLAGQDTSILYSFVADNTSKVAAMTIHLINVVSNNNTAQFYKISNARAVSYKTLEEAINLASDLDDNVAKEFFEKLVKKDNCSLC